MAPPQHSPIDNSNSNEYGLGNEMKASTTIGKITTKDNKDKDILHLHNLNSCWIWQPVISQDPTSEPKAG
jgi:hypothetical protein